MTLQTVAATLAGAAPAMANHLWQSTVFAAIAACLALALRKNRARARYWVWMSASMKLLLPFALLAGAASHWAKPRAVVPANAPMYVAVEDVSEPFAAEGIGNRGQGTENAAAEPTHRASARDEWGTLVLGAVWFAGFVTILVAWGVRWRRVAKAMREAAPLHEGREVEALRRIEAAAGVRRPIELRVSADAMEPGVFGILRPVLAWPERISERLDDAQLEAVLAHEVYHVRRRDNLAAALHMLVEAAFWFHPMVWWMGARLVAERERACDEEVVERCGRPTAYAESILKVCEFCVSSPLECVSGVTGADLKQRVVEIMSARVVRKLTPAKKLLIGSVVACVLAVPFVLGQAQAARRMTAMAITPPSLHTLAAAIQSAGDHPISVQAPPEPGSMPAPDQTSDKPFRFDVVSIRPSNPNQDRRLIKFQLTDDGLVATNTSLALMLTLQYQRELQMDSSRIVGGPDWARTLSWDVRAKVADSDVAAWSELVHDPSPAAKARQRATVETMLAERFGLKMHSEAREGTVYAMMVADGGLKIKPTTKAAGHQSIRSLHPGNFEGTIEIPVLASFFAQELGHPVVDKTGMTGLYDFTLDWQPMPGSPSSTPGSSDEQGSSAPSLFTAAQEQLGLKLVAQKGPVTHLVIDHAEKPSVDGAEVSDPAGAKRLQVALVRQKATATAGAEGGSANSSASADSAAAYVPTMTFDVASVRQNKEADLSRGITMSGQFTPHTTNLRLINWRIESILSDAFGIQEWQVVGAPKWPYPTVFVIEAKGDADVDAKMAALPPDEQRMEQQHMLQALLADRFKLKTHWETKQGDVYNLVVAKGGPKLGAEGSMPPSADEVKIFGDRPIPALRQKNDGRGYDFIGHACPINYLVDTLIGQFGRPVIDKTGLSGKYDFVLKYKGRWDSDRDAGDMDPTPPMDHALQEQLGLKVESAKGPVKVLVIDHIEMPSEN